MLTKLALILIAVFGVIAISLLGTIAVLGFKTYKHVKSYTKKN